MHASYCFSSTGSSKVLVSKDTWIRLCWMESGISNTDFAIDQLRNSHKIHPRSGGNKQEGNNGELGKTVSKANVSSL